MDDKTIATMNDAEFDALVDCFIERGEKVKAGWVNDSDFEQEPVK